MHNCCDVAVGPLGPLGVFHLPVGAAALHKCYRKASQNDNATKDFSRRLAADHFLIVSWVGVGLTMLVSTRFALSLERDATSKEPFIESIITTGDVIDALTGESLKLSLPEACERLQGFLIGSDGTSSLVIRLPSPYCPAARSNGFVYDSDDQVPELGRRKLRMAGSIYETFAVDEASVE